MVKTSGVISIRFDKADLEKLNNRPQNLSVSAYCKEIILQFIDSGNELVKIESLRNELRYKNDLIDSVNKNLKDLQQMNGYLIQENTRISKINERILLPENSKKWWHFWR